MHEDTMLSSQKKIIKVNQNELIFISKKVYYKSLILQNRNERFKKKRDQNTHQM